ncbi:Ras-specific guanine nucleotide-releasing factor 2 [Tupaia chinensis]|uniref:Ras-specific guanine nucleotide-releasing factor 2 n=1 Tax=Tupaia chinensis TaxID=246437 RepID=L9L4Y8_TUPCH|nr:Ras-specific guanine nucleotide-releasing factor 2 [Tupaia chinensis]
MQKSVRYNEGHALYLAFLARKEGTKRGFLGGVEPLAREVVRALPECALLLRGRAERPPGGHVPPGGLQLRAGARAAQGRRGTRRRPGRAGQAGHWSSRWPAFMTPVVSTSGPQSHHTELVLILKQTLRFAVFSA